MCRQSLFWARGLIVATEVCVITAEGILECGEEDREGRVQCRDKSFLRKIRTQALSGGSRRVRLFSQPVRLPVIYEVYQVLETV